MHSRVRKDLGLKKRAMFHILALLRKGNEGVFQSHSFLRLMSGRMNILSHRGYDDMSYLSDPARHFSCSLVLVMGVDTVKPQHLEGFCLAVWTTV